MMNVGALIYHFIQKSEIEILHPETTVLFSLFNIKYLIYINNVIYIYIIFFKLSNNYKILSSML